MKRVLAWILMAASLVLFVIVAALQITILFVFAVTAFIAMFALKLSSALKDNWSKTIAWFEAAIRSLGK